MDHNVLQYMNNVLQYITMYHNVLQCIEINLYYKGIPMYYIILQCLTIY